MTSIAIPFRPDTPIRVAARTAVTGALLGIAVPALGCPFCASDTGRRIYAGIFDASFGPTLLQVLSPFPVLLGIVLGLHLALRDLR